MNRHARPKSHRRTAIAVAVIGGLGVAVGFGAIATPRPHRHPAPTVSPSPVPSPTPSRPVSRPPRPSVTPTVRPTLKVPQNVSVTVLRLDDGATYQQGSGRFDTASIVKVDILSAALLQAQDAGRSLTDDEDALAARMIENSDNAAATALWQDIGDGTGLDRANRRFGLTDTNAGEGQYWGLTQTTSADQVRLLRQVFGGPQKLTSASQEYVQRLMANVEADQRWGVSAAGSSYKLKNGWLQRTATGLWDVNSIGEVQDAGHQYLIAVLSKDNRTESGGIRLVETVARSAMRSAVQA